MKNVSGRGPETSVEDGPVSLSSAPGGVRRSTVATLERYGLPILLVLVVVVFSATEAQFHSVANVQAVFAGQSTLILVALAAMIPLVGGEFDLSVAAIMGTSTIATAAALSSYNLTIPTAATIGVGVGIVVGMINGAIVAYLGVNSLIVTLGMSTVLPGLVTWYTAGISIVRNLPADLGVLATGTTFGIPRSFLWVVPFIIVIWFLLTQTPWGRRLEAIGANRDAAVLVGIRSRRITFQSFVLSGALSGVAGVLTLARDGNGNPQLALGGMLLPALAAVFLGSTAFTPGRYNVWGTLTAVFFVAFSVSGLTLMGAQPWVQQVFDGVALIFAVTLQTLIARSRAAGSTARERPGASGDPSSAAAVASKGGGDGDPSRPTETGVQS